MAEWLRRPHLRDIKCTVYDLEVMSSSPNRFKLGVYSTSGVPDGQAVKITVSRGHKIYCS